MASTSKDIPSDHENKGECSKDGTDKAAGSKKCPLRGRCPYMMYTHGMGWQQHGRKGRHGKRRAKSADAATASEGEQKSKHPKSRRGKCPYLAKRADDSGKEDSDGSRGCPYLDAEGDFGSDPWHSFMVMMMMQQNPYMMGGFPGHRSGRSRCPLFAHGCPFAKMSSCPMFGGSSRRSCPMFGRSSGSCPMFGRRSGGGSCPMFGGRSGGSCPMFGGRSGGSCPMFSRRSGGSCPMFGGRSSGSCPMFGGRSGGSCPMFQRRGYGTSSCPMFGYGGGHHGMSSCPMFGHGGGMMPFGGMSPYMMMPFMGYPHGYGESESESEETGKEEECGDCECQDEGEEEVSE